MIANRRTGTIVVVLIATTACSSNGGLMNPAERVLHEQVTRGKTPGLQYRYLSPDSVLFRYDDGVASVAKRTPVTSATTFNGFSVTKTFTAIAVLQLVERGLVKLDEPAATYLPGFPYPATITVRQLLTHSAGIPNPIPMRWTHLESEHATFNRNEFFKQQFAANPKVTSAPNTKFAYSNLGYQLLGQLIEAVTKQSYEQYVTDNILAKLGTSPTELGFALNPAIHARGYHKRMSLTYPVLGFVLDKSRSMEGSEDGWEMFRLYYMNGAAYGGLIGTADGFARYLQVLLSDAPVLLSAESKKLLFTENILNGGKHSGIALAWFLDTLDGHSYFNHAGGGGGYYAELRIYPALRRGSVVLFNRTGMTNAHFLNQVDTYFLRGESASAGAAGSR